MCWEIGNGETVKFWKDRWLESGRSLLECCVKSLDKRVENCIAKEMVCINGEWDFHKMGDLIPDTEKRLIAAVLAPREEFGRDVVKWGTTLGSDYVVLEMYQKLREEQGVVDVLWSSLWKWKGPRRVQVFMWIAAHDRLLAAERRSRIMGGAELCYCCIGKTESLMHVLRDCRVAKSSVGGARRKSEGTKILSVGREGLVQMEFKG